MLFLRKKNFLFEFHLETQVVDENDSGNDEPSEGQLSNERCNRSQGSQNQASYLSRYGIERSLYERVKELTVGAANESKITDIDHMAKLPPEGNSPNILSTYVELITCILYSCDFYFQYFS